MVDLFSGPRAPLSGPGLAVGTATQASAALNAPVTQAASLGSVEKLVYNATAVKTLCVGSKRTVMTVQSLTPVFASAKDMQDLASRYADAPTPQHPTVVKVVTLARSGATALTLDQQIDTGMDPAVTRSAAITIGNVGYTVYIGHSRSEAELIDIADDVWRWPNKHTEAGGYRQPTSSLDRKCA